MPHNPLRCIFNGEAAQKRFQIRKILGKSFLFVCARMLDNGFWLGSVEMRLAAAPSINGHLTCIRYIRLGSSHAPSSQSICKYLCYMKNLGLLSMQK